jgi:hypothetical protein
MHAITMIGLDLAKSSFHAYGVDRHGNMVFGTKMILLPSHQSP